MRLPMRRHYRIIRCQLLLMAEFIRRFTNSIVEHMLRCKSGILRQEQMELMPATMNRKEYDSFGYIVIDREYMDPVEREQFYTKQNEGTE